LRSTPPKLRDAGDGGWPSIDATRFLSTEDIAAVCHVKPDDLRISLGPLGSPTKDPLGEDRVAYAAAVARTAPSSRTRFMGIVIQTRDTAEHAAELLKVWCPPLTPIPGTELATHRLERDRSVYREVAGHYGRFLFTVSETDDVDETIVCDDGELIELVRLLERRLPQ
jgi:hypothetical protein